MKNEEFDAHLAETDKLIDRLHSLYEQWFMGIERREPTKQREILQRRVDGLRHGLPRNTALRFRAQGIISRWVTLTHHWNKVARQIEEGTYKRDVLRAKRKAAERDEREKRLASQRAARNADAGARGAASSPPTEGLGGWQLDDASFDDAFDRLLDEAPVGNFSDEVAAVVVAPRVPATPSLTEARPIFPPSLAEPPRPPGQPAPPSAGGAAGASGRPAPPPPPRATPSRAAPPPPPPRAVVSEKPAPPRGPDYESIYQRYVDARKQNNERVDNVRLESVVASLEKQIPELKKKHGEKAIDFEVVVRDGRVGLKPIVR